MTLPFTTDYLLALASAENFHRSLVLPATKLHGPLRVTFAVAGVLDGSPPTIMWMSGMFGTRYKSFDVDDLAKRMGVRVIFCDRPGMGGSTPVDLRIRLQVWLETVLALICHLNTKHVALGSHSAGIIYLLNTLYHLPHILSPSKAYVAMAGKLFVVNLLLDEISPENSGVKAMAIAKMLPGAMIGKYNILGNFIRTTILPAAGSSGGAIDTLLQPFQSTSFAENKAAKEVGAAAAYGIPLDKWKELDIYLTKFSLAEDSTGANSEAMLCMKKGGPDLWDIADDYATYVSSFVKLIEEKAFRIHEAAPVPPEADDSPVPSAQTYRIQAFFAESDSLIGSQGQSYFEQCWGSQKANGLLDFQSSILQSTNHDSVCNPEHGMFDEIFEGARIGLS